MAAPSEEALEKCTKEQLLKIAEHSSAVVKDKSLKENVKVALKSKLIKIRKFCLFIFYYHSKADIK